MALVEVKDLGMTFGAIEALKDVTFAIRAGEVVGLMGDNGAGKSTTLKILAGNFPPSNGAVHIEGSAASFCSPRDAQDAGIEVVYQDLALCNNLTAAQNVFLGREITRGIWPFKMVDRRRMERETQALFDELESDTRPNLPVARMSGGQRQVVAISRAIRSKAKLVLLDEPTAAISVRQVHEVLELIRKLKSQGAAVMLISHRMPDIFEVCDRVIVLRRGRKVADKEIESTTPEEVTGLITGAIDAA